MVIESDYLDGEVKDRCSQNVAFALRPDWGEAGGPVKSIPEREGLVKGPEVGSQFGVF